MPLVKSNTWYPDDVDVCIIGGGPAGLAVAHHLTCRAASGIRVLVIESGGDAPDAETQKLSEGLSVGYPYYNLGRMQQRAIGGASHIWSGRGPRSRPLDALDFTHRPWVPHSGWPFSHDELEPYYRRAAELLGIHHSFGPDQWATLGDHPWPMSDIEGQSLDSIVFQHGEREAFVNLAADLERRPTLEFRRDTTVVEIGLDADGSSVDHLVVAPSRATGPRRKVRARMYVIATGSVAVAQLLLSSTSRHPDGVGNAHDLVGRYFADHLGLRTGLVLDDHGGSPIDRARFYTNHSPDQAAAIPGWQGMLSPNAEAQQQEQLLNTAWWILPLPWAITTNAAHALAHMRRIRALRPRPTGLLRAAATVVANPLDALRALRVRDQRFGVGPADVLQLKAMAEQVPNPHSRVMLARGSGQVDRHGRRRPVVQWRLTNQDLSSIARSQRVIDRVLQASRIGCVANGLRALGDPHDFTRHGIMLHGHEHQLGTTRMHVDPRHGVVDEHSRVHGITDLFVAGGAVLPTIGHANPTMTVLALSIRLADEIRARLQA